MTKYLQNLAIIIPWSFAVGSGLELVALLLNLNQANAIVFAMAFGVLIGIRKC